MDNNKKNAENLELNKVLEYQDEVRAAVKTIAGLEAAIEVQQATINLAKDFESGLPNLHVRREDLLAEMITGGANKEELSILDEEIRIEKERLDKLVSHAEEAVPIAKQTIAGLRRKLEATIADFETLKSRKPAILADFIKAEAEQVGAEYIQMAMALGVKYHQLLSYGPLIRAINGNYRIESCKALIIPLFTGIEAHKGYDNPSIPGEIWELLGDRKDANALQNIFKEERARLEGFGVEW